MPLRNGLLMIHDIIINNHRKREQESNLLAQEMDKAKRVLQMEHRQYEEYRRIIPNSFRFEENFDIACFDENIVPNEKTQKISNCI